MPSKKFAEYMDGLGAEPPRGFPEGVPMLPAGYEPPDPVVPEGYSGGKAIVGGIPGIFLARPGMRERSCFMHIHGGGYTVGSAMECMGILQRFAEDCRLEGFSVEYRLAPGAVFPAAVEDCIAFYAGLLEKGYEHIVVGGESAGATLSLSLTHALKARGLMLPAAIWCSSPVDDALYSRREYFRHDPFIGLCEEIFNIYAPGADPEDPLLSPVFGDFSGFPPLCIQAGGAESLAAGAVRLAAKAAAADVDVVFRYGKGMGHTYAMLYGAFPEATNAMREITRFVNDNLNLDA